jgi:hypothetical protein
MHCARWCVKHFSIPILSLQQAYEMGTIIPTFSLNEENIA